MDKIGAVGTETNGCSQTLAYFNQYKKEGQTQQASAFTACNSVFGNGFAVPNQNA